MNKKIIKIGALALGMFTFVAMYANAQNTGEGVIRLNISQNPSQCNFNDFNLGTGSMQLDQGLTMSGVSDTAAWICEDNKGGKDRTWAYTISATDLTGAKGGVISNDLIYIRHAAGVVEGSTECVGGSSTTGSGYSFGEVDPYTLIERTATVGGLCKVTLNNVTVQVDIPANQIPDSYQSTINTFVPEEVDGLKIVKE